MVLPWGAIEAGLRFASLLLEGVPVEQRRAQSVAWFYMWWPVLKLFLKDEQEKQIEAIMKTISTEAPRG